jgi:hypothetical protein
LSSLSRNYRGLANVPNRNVFKYNIAQIDALLQVASSNLGKAQKIASQASDDLGKVKSAISTTESNLKIA